LWVLGLSIDSINGGRWITGTCCSDQYQYEEVKTSYVRDVTPSRFGVIIGFTIFEVYQLFSTT